MTNVTIKIMPNGPYVIEGEVAITDSKGEKPIISDKKSIALCRCGGSDNKPFCDGTHKRIGFQAP